MTLIMYVCLGNICRSPAAEAILKKKLDERGLSDKFLVQSSGIGAWHVGHTADSRMRESAFNRGYLLAGRAQQFESSFFDQFDYILAADHAILHELHKMAKTPEQKAKVHLMTAFSKTCEGQEVPDPYCGNLFAFEEVLDILEESCEAFAQHLTREW